MASWKRDARMLDRSLEVARNPMASVVDRLRAAQFLVSYGALKEADQAMAAVYRTVEANNIVRSPMAVMAFERLVAINTHFRQQHIGAKLRRLGSLGHDLLDADREAVLIPAKGARTLLVVFSTMYSDFWVSYPVLHCLLPSDTTSILYLKDPRGMMYLQGLAAYGETFDALCAGVRKIAADLSIDDIRVTAFSSGGYAALLLATSIRAGAYLGFSIRTDLAARRLCPATDMSNAARCGQRSAT